MPIPAHDLPEGVISWLQSNNDAEITRLERHVARREAWVVDLAKEPGEILEGFLRIDRSPHEGKNISLRREARICEALEPTAVPVPRLLGWNEKYRAALFSRDPGTADLPGVTNRQQQTAVLQDFMSIVARLHQLDPASLSLEDVLGPLPTSARDCALGDLDLQLSEHATFLAEYCDPLLSYGVNWLQRFAPEKVARVSLVQGDTGPVNFLFKDRAVTSVVDWEWGHWGDPMEDLGNICVREFWNPSGGLKGLFKLYEEASGIPYTRFSAQYYRIQQNVRGMIPIHAACESLTLGESLAWYLCYRYVGDRATCEALADAMDVPIDRPELPEETGTTDNILEAADVVLARDIAPALGTPFSRSRLSDARILLQCARRRHYFQPQLQAIECEEIAALLGRAQQDYRASIRSLVTTIEEQRVPDDRLIRYLARKAYREEWLHQPAADLYPDRRWAALD